VDERDVLYATVPNEPGSLGRVVKMLAEAGINLDYAYASGIDRVPMVAVVLGVADPSAPPPRPALIPSHAGAKARSRNTPARLCVERQWNAPIY
jgi:hypothetical protein